MRLVHWSGGTHKSLIINLGSDKQSLKLFLLTLNLNSVLQTGICEGGCDQGAPGLIVMKHRSAFPK